MFSFVGSLKINDRRFNKRLSLIFSYNITTFPLTTGIVKQ